METLYNKLKRYAKDDYIPFHMPGHKRNAEKFGMGEEINRDITEIDGFDDLHYPQGILKAIEDNAAKVYGTKRSLYLVNGSSCGILTAISATLQPDKKIIIARNSHKSVYNGVSINHLMPYYIYPEVLEFGIMGEIKAEQVEQALKESGAQVVLITSPTYEGVVSDVEKIAQVCHKNNAVLIVDEAHGAHFAFHSDFPENAIKCGADLVIESLHKTLPCYTQTAILHVNSERIDLEKVKRYYSIYQTSSPSYLFMGGINQCIDYMISDEGKKENQIYIDEVKKLREKIKKLKYIKLFDEETFDYDISKIVLCCRGKGAYLYEELINRYHIQLEMAAADYVIAMTSIGDKAEWYEKFYSALAGIDDKLFNQSCISNVNMEDRYDIIKADVKMKPSKALEAEGEFVNRKMCIGRIAQEALYAYPPGIPIVYPGESLTKELVSQMEKTKEDGITIKGYADGIGEHILCIR